MRKVTKTSTTRAIMMCHSLTNLVLPVSDLATNCERPIVELTLRITVAAEYIAAGYTFSDPIIQRFIDLDSEFDSPCTIESRVHNSVHVEKHGISSRFTSWFDSINTTVGSKVLGPDQTVTGGVSSALGGVSNKARSIDEQKGISKTANDVRSRLYACRMLLTDCDTVITVLLEGAFFSFREEGVRVLHHHHQAGGRYPRRGKAHR